MNCTEVLDRFVFHLDGELGDADGRPLESHLESCASCREGAHRLAVVHRDLLRRAALAEIRARDPVPALLARACWERARARRRVRRVEPRRPWAAAAAAIAAAVLLGLALSKRAPAPSSSGSVPAPTAAVPIPFPEPPTLEPPADLPLPALTDVPGPDVRPVPVPAPAPRPAAPPRPPEPAPAPRETTTAKIIPVAAVERLDGTLTLASGRSCDDGLAAGDSLHVAGRAVIVYPDGTRLHVGDGTSLTLGDGMAVALHRGEIGADVAPQRGTSMVFTTPGAEVKVLGTWLAIAAGPDATRVQVEKGHVRVTRRADRWTIPLREGHYAVVEPGRLPVARPLPANLLAEPGFEAGGLAWGGVWNRALDRNYGGVGIAASPRRSLLLTTDRAPGRDREVFQDLPAAEGDTVEFAAWVRTERVAGQGLRLSLVWLSERGQFFEDLTAALRARGAVLREDAVGALSGTCGWTRVGGRSVAPPGTRQARALVYVDSDPSAPSYAWVDDAVFRRHRR